MSRINCGALLLVLAITATAIDAAQPREERIALDQAAQAIRQKNYQDAYAHYRALALDPGATPSRAADSLKAAIECLEELARGEEADALRDATIAAHNDQWRVLLATAQTLAETTHTGYIIDGKFLREWAPNHKGQFVYCFRSRDRVLAACGFRGPGGAELAREGNRPCRPSRAAPRIRSDSSHGKGARRN